MEIVNIKISKLKPYEKNAKTHPKENIEAIKKSIEKYGFADPIGVWGKQNIIVEGHGRYLACKELGIDEVPCIRLDHLSDEERREYTLLHNKTTMMSDFDLDLLGDELLELDLSDFELDWGLPELVQEEKEVEDDDFDCTPPEQPKAKLGDIYQLGNHRLMCGDSTSLGDIEKLIDGQHIDLVYTDAPYGISVVGDDGTIGGGGATSAGKYMKVKGDETTDTAKEFYQNCIALNIDKFILWGGNYFTDFLPFSPSWLIWDKRVDMNSNNFADGEMAWCSFKTPVRIYHQLWAGMIREGEHEDRVHPTQKPIRIQTEILNDFSNENDNVLDGFGGSGSTLIACEKTNRNCFMIEYEPHYVDIIIARWEQFTGKKSEKIN